MKQLWLLVTLALVTALPAGAQNTTPALNDTRWAAWIGCWVPDEAANSARDIRECVVPTADGRGVRMLTFAGDRQIFEEVIVADHSPQAYAQDSCTGERRGQWSADAERVFTTAQLKCEGKAAVTTRGITTVLKGGDWLDLQVTEGADEPRVRVRRYIRSLGAWPPSIQADASKQPALSPLQATATTAADVAEAHKLAGPLAVQAWIVESAADVAVDKRTLIGLADQGVSEQVIDLLVARAYPKKFEVREPSRGGGWGPIPITLSGLGRFVDPDALYFAPFGPYYYGGLYDNYYQYAGYQIIAPPAPSVPTGGQVVNGRGYTQVRERVPETATSRGGNTGGGGGGGGDASAPSGAGSSGSSDGGVSSSGYAGGGGFTGVTAIPK